MRTKIQRKGKLAIVCALGAVALVSFGGFFLLRAAGQKEPAPRREYPVQQGDIIVGIDAAGGIVSEKYRQMLDVPLQIEQYLVKIGDFVREGDVLAEISKTELDKKRKTADETVQTDGFGVEKLKTEKQNHQLEFEKKAGDVRAAGESAYQEKAGAFLAKKAAAEQGIADKKANIAQLQQTRAATQTEKDTRVQTIATLVAEIDTLRLQNEALQQEIEALTADTGTDHSAKIAELIAKKLENELASAEKAREKTRLESTDYDALLTQASAQIAQLEAEIQTLTLEIAAVQESLKQVDAQRTAAKAEEDATIALLTKQAQAQQAVYDNDIRQAQSKYDASKQARDKLRDYQANPRILAQKEGVVTALGQGQGQNADAQTVQVAEIGLENKKTLLVQVDPMEITDVATGQAVSFYVDAYPDTIFHGTVERKSSLQNDKGKFEVTVSFVPTEQPLLEGMGANATLVVKQKLGVITLSNKAICFENGKSIAYVADETGKLQPKEITTGFSNGRVTEILSGLAAGDTVWVEEPYEDA